MADVTKLSHGGLAPFLPASAEAGVHATTRMAATLLRDALARRPGARVLDVGAGTGTLCRIALDAGAGEVVGIDHQDEIIDAARHRVPGARFRVADARDYLTQFGGGAFDVVVANLPDPPLLTLVPDLAAAARLGGVLVITGVLLWQADALRQALVEAGATPSAPIADSGWCAFTASC